MTINEIDTRIKSIIFCFNQNAYAGEELPENINCLSEQEKELIKKEFLNRLQEESYLDKDKKSLGAEEFRRSTACEAKDEASARAFFQAVYAYAFEGGEEPEVEDFEEDY